MNRIAILVASPRKNGSPGVKHHGNAVGLSGSINDLQLLHAIQIIVGKQKLMWRMDLDHANSEPQNLLHIGQDVRSMPRMQATAGKQSLRILLNVVCDELIHAI